MNNQRTFSQTGVHEECGVFGIYDLDHQNVAPSIYYGLCALQHRGQESCGIALTDTTGPKGNIQVHKGLGLVSEVFRSSTLESLHGDLGVGHVRYSTTGASVVENAQPLVLNYQKGTLVLAHNGNLINTDSLREKLEQTGTVFHSTTDSEVLACLIAQARVRTGQVEDAIIQAVSQIQGAYGLVISSPRKLIGVRDPYGLKPLGLGKRDHAWILASESCALDSVGAEFVRDLLPGEILTISADGLHSNTSLMIPKSKQAHCIFEYIYFARLDSTLDGINVYESRLRAGAALAKAYPVDADLVAGVPDSGLAAAQGYAQEANIPFSLIFHKNSYVGRTFIKPTQKERENSVRLKLNVLSSVVKGKRIVLIDDSMVRGTTMANLIQMLKHAGALEVHVRICSPPFMHPCYFGTDVPSNKELIASSHSTEEICSIIQADSLGYMKIEDLSEMTKDLPLCKACFDNHYPMPVPSDK